MVRWFPCVLVPLMAISLGCATRFPLTRETTICGDHWHVSSGGSMVLLIAENRLAEELAQRTGRQWNSRGVFAWKLKWWGIFGIYAGFEDAGEVPKGAVGFAFLRSRPKPEPHAFRVMVKADSVLIEASSGKGFDQAIDALLSTLREENGEFCFPVQTLSP